MLEEGGGGGEGEVHVEGKLLPNKREVAVPPVSSLLNCLSRTQGGDPGYI